MDIYLPSGQQPIYPPVVLLYGSAWLGNDLKGRNLETLGAALLDAGFAVVAPNHRSSRDSIFPAQIHDIKAVVRFIRSHADEYQLDTSFVGVAGSSSGGHLAALTGTSRLVKQYTVGSVSADLEGRVGSDTTFSSSVDAIVDWFGPTDFLVMDSCGSRLVHDAPTSPESRLIGGAIQQNRDKVALANPITYVDANDTSFLILHGTEDPLVPPCQSEMLHEALIEVGGSSELVLIPGGRHGRGVFEEQYFERMANFFQSVYQAVLDKGDESK